MSELTAFNAYCKSNGINANGQLATEDLAPAFSAGYKARQDTLRQRVAELEGELDDFESDIDTCTQHNVELQLEVTKLTAERDELNNIAENIGDLHHVTLDEWAAMKAERDALKQQRDDLLAAIEAIEIDAEECLDFDECTAMLVPIDTYHKLMEAIASVNEK